MNKPQSAISTIVLLASIVNIFGAVKKGKDITYPIMGGFIVLILLLALAEANEQVAEMFAGAYGITCALTNGQDLFEGISQAITSGKRFDPGAQGAGTDAGAQPASYSTVTRQTTTTAPRSV